MPKAPVWERDVLFAKRMRAYFRLVFRGVCAQLGQQWWWGAEHNYGDLQAW
jgi:hypothetical protein